MKHGELLVKHPYGLYYYYKIKHSFKYRCGPVPYVSKWKHVHFHRRIKTKQEATINHDCEYVRLKRKKLPNAWDDIPRSDYNIKCWKNYRKTQYK